MMISPATNDVGLYRFLTAHRVRFWTIESVFGGGGIVRPSYSSIVQPFADSSLSVPIIRRTSVVLARRDSFANAG